MMVTAFARAAGVRGRALDSAEGRPIQALNYRITKRETLESPLRAAVRTKHRKPLDNGYSLVFSLSHTSPIRSLDHETICLACIASRWWGRRPACVARVAERSAVAVPHLG